jgi:hypothetical protein
MSCKEMNDFYKISIDQDGKFVQVIFADVIIATISDSHLIDIDFITFLRSSNLQEEAYKAIAEAIKIYNDQKSNFIEDMSFNSIVCIKDVFGLTFNGSQLFSNIENDNILISINALNFKYNNFWHSCRLVLNDKVRPLFLNNSDEENDIISALFLTNKLDVVQFFINHTKMMPNVKINDNIDNWNATAQMIQSQIIKDSYDPGDFNKGDDFDSLNDAMEYYKKYNN